MSQSSGPSAGQQLQGSLEGWLDAQVRQGELARGRQSPAADTLEQHLAAMGPVRQALWERLRLSTAPPPAPGFAVQRVAAPAGRALDRLVWEPWQGVRQDALLLRADAARRPTIVVAHGLSSSPEETLHPDGLTAPLVQGLLAAGFHVLVPRLVAGWPARLRLARKARLLGREWLGLETLGLLRLLDRLGQVSVVDPAALGIVGLSRGGQLALLAAALDPRLHAVTVASWFTDRTAKLLDDADARQSSFLASPEDEQFLPGWLPEFDDVRLCALIAPRPLLITSRLDDPVICWEQVQERFAAVAQVYQMLDFAEFCRLELAGGGHEPLPEVTVEFCCEWLAPRAAAVSVSVAPRPFRRLRRPRPRVVQPRRRRR